MTGPGERVARLREEFDRTFSRPRGDEAAPTEEVLAISVGDLPCALRVRELAALEVDRKIVPVPGPVAELLGVVGVRGEILAVYDLGALLGRPSAAAPRWLAVCAEGELRAGLAFHALEGMRRVPASALRPAPPGTSPLHPLHLIDGPGAGRPVVAASGVLAAIRDRARWTMKER